MLFAHLLFFGVAIVGADKPFGMLRGTFAALRDSGAMLGDVEPGPRNVHRMDAKLLCGSLVLECEVPFRWVLEVDSRDKE